MVNRNKGFTLIEVLISIGIIIFLTGITVANFQGSKDIISLKRSAHKLAQDLRRVQEMAMSVEEIGFFGEEFYPDGGFGIYFDLNNPLQYVFFADCIANGQYQTGNICGQVGNKFPETYGDPIILKSKVEITGLSPVSPHLHITFKAPDPIVYISGGDEAEITLSLPTGETRTVKVNSVGLITIE